MYANICEKLCLVRFISVLTRDGILLFKLQSSENTYGNYYLQTSTIVTIRYVISDFVFILFTCNVFVHAKRLSELNSRECGTKVDSNRNSDLIIS